MLLTIARKWFCEWIMTITPIETPLLRLVLMRPQNTFENQDEYRIRLGPSIDRKCQQPISGHSATSDPSRKRICDTMPKVSFLLATWRKQSPYNQNDPLQLTANCPGCKPAPSEVTLPTPGPRIRFARSVSRLIILSRRKKGMCEVWMKSVQVKWLKIASKIQYKHTNSR